MEKTTTVVQQQTPKNSVELWKANSETEISSAVSIRTILEIDSMPVSSLVKSKDKSEAYQFIKMHVVVLCEYFGVSWNDTQIQQSSKVLYDNFYFWTSAIWQHFSERCRGLFFGKMYGQFTPAVLIEWAHEYEGQRSLEVEGLTTHSHDLIRKIDEKERTDSEREQSEKEQQFRKVLIEHVKSQQNDTPNK